MLALHKPNAFAPGRSPRGKAWTAAAPLRPEARRGEANPLMPSKPAPAEAARQQYTSHESK